MEYSSLGHEVESIIPTGGHFYNLKSITFLVNSNYGAVYDLLHYLKPKKKPKTKTKKTPSNLVSLVNTPSIQSGLFPFPKLRFRQTNYWWFFRIFNFILSLVIGIWPAVLVSKWAANSFSDHVF